MRIRRRARKPPAMWLRLALLGAALGVAAFATARLVDRENPSGAASATDWKSEPFPADYPRGEAPCPDFQLVDQAGTPFGPARLRGRPAVVAFVFSHCQAICPGLVHDVREAARAVGPDAAQLVLITIDPARDSPAVLPRIASEWQLGPSEWLLSGPPSEVERLLDAFDVARAPDALTGEVAHPPLVVILDPQGRQAYRLNAPPIAWIADAVRRSRTR